MKLAALVLAATLGPLAFAPDAMAAPKKKPPKPDSRSQPKAAAKPDMTGASIEELQKAMAAGRITSRELTQQYLARIQAFDKAGPKLNSVIELNPDALAQAEALDRERAAGSVRGPLHGIPVLLKDNIATADRMTTTAGSIALAGVKAPRDAFV